MPSRALLLPLLLAELLLRNLADVMSVARENPKDVAFQASHFRLSATVSRAASVELHLPSLGAELRRK